MAEQVDFKISDSTHPDYDINIMDWQKFRYIMDGGDEFVEQYLQSYSARENAGDFLVRKSITPNPSFASAGITDIKNAIFQRMIEITRSGGSKTYQQVVTGELGGVDLLGANMNYFVGNEILPELLNLGKVGVFVDMPAINDEATLKDTQSLHPYFYMYAAEDIRNWRLSRHGEFIEFDMLLLRERTLTYDNLYSLPDEDSVRYRLLVRKDDAIEVSFFDDEGKQIDMDGNPTTEVIELNIKKIPFVLFELNQSLLKNIANHQIALLNLESSDIGYALLSNFPFYTEEQSRTKSAHLKSDESEDGDTREIEVGGSVGRTYGQGLHPPSFIHPSSEPLQASMAKQKNLKDDIRTLINLALSAIQPKYASAEAKQMDEHGLESGLSFLGLILEHGERQLASLFAEFENSIDIATITYPERYALKSDSERLAEADNLHDIALKIPSKQAQKALSKLAVQKILETRVSRADMETILKEIDEAEYSTADPDIVHTDIEKGLVSTETASGIRGYNAEKEVPKAAEEHAERAKRILNAQTAARGVEDLSNDNNAGKDDKTRSQDSDLQNDTSKPVRGEE